MKSYPRNALVRSDKGFIKIGHIPLGFRYFLLPLCCDSVAVHQVQLLPRVVRKEENIRKRSAKHTYKMRSKDDRRKETMPNEFEHHRLHPDTKKSIWAIVFIGA